MLSSLLAMGQTACCDSVFHTYVYNDEYQVYLDIDLYAQNVTVPGQEVLGAMCGYFGAVRDSRKWLITSAKVDGGTKAELEIVNDYGSEDLTATLTYCPDGNRYVLRQTGGSRLRIVVNRKWVKLPNELTFTPHVRVRNAY